MRDARNKNGDFDRIIGNPAPVEPFWWQKSPAGEFPFIVFQWLLELNGVCSPSN